jgi:hypothetical protein
VFSPSSKLDKSSTSVIGSHGIELFFSEEFYFFSIYCIYLDKDWLHPKYHDKDHTRIKKPDELESSMIFPPEKINDEELDKIRGSLIGLALGDALGAHVEFRPRQYLLGHPVTDLEPGGTWGLKKGQVLMKI